MSDSLISQAHMQARLLDAYAAGRLDAGMRLLVETQANLRPAQEFALIAAAGGAMLEQEAPTAMAADALSRVMAQIDSLPAAAGRRAPYAGEVSKLPQPLRAAALEALDKSSWQFGGPGIRILPFKLENSAHAELIRIEPGFAAPKHTHTAGEYTLVLTGAFADDLGRYGVGDVAYADASVVHTPRAEPGDVCYNLAISEAPLVLLGALGAIQRMLPN